MADDWEDWEEKCVPKVSKAWDDEEEEDDDEEDDAPAVQKKQPAKKPADNSVKKSAPAKPNSKGKKQGQDEEEEEILDPYAEKAKREKLVKKADYENVLDLMGGDSSAISDDEDQETDKKVKAAFTPTTIGSKIDALEPKNEKEYIELAGLLATKATKYQKSRFYNRFVVELVNKSVDSLTPKELNELANRITAKANEKLQQEKKLKQQKNAPKKKVDLYEDFVEDEYDDFLK